MSSVLDLFLLPILEQQTSEVEGQTVDSILSSFNHSFQSFHLFRSTLENSISHYFASNRDTYPTLTFLCKNFVLRVVNSHPLPHSNQDVLSKFMKWVTVMYVKFLSSVNVYSHHTILPPLEGQESPLVPRVKMTGQGLLYDLDVSEVEQLSTYFLNIGYFSIKDTDFLENYEFADRCISLISTLLDEGCIEGVDVARWLGDEQEYVARYKNFCIDLLSEEKLYKTVNCVLGDRLIFLYG
jgi:hypothetical protein